MKRYSVPEMSCAHCQKTIESALQELDALVDITFDLEQHQIALTTAASSEQVMATMKEAGYEASVI